MLLVVALVLGILGMHAMMGPVGGAMPMASAGSAAATAGGHHDGADPTPAAAGEACPGCDAPAGHHTGHSVASMCLAVLGGTLLLAVLAAVLLRWASPVGGARPAVARRRRTSRGPPPHQVSLLQLCLQRV